MKFEFEQTIEDILDLSKNSLAANNTFKYFGVFFAVIFLINSVPTLISGNLSLDALIAWGLPIVIIGIVWFLIYKFAIKRRFANSDNKKVMLGKRVIELLDNEILVETPISNTSYKWSAITKLSQSKKSYFLYLGNAQALIIPKRVINSEEDRIALEEFVHDRIGNG